MIITSSKPINPTVSINPQGWIGILVGQWVSSQLCHGDITTPVYSKPPGRKCRWTGGVDMNTRTEADCGLAVCADHNSDLRLDFEIKHEELRSVAVSLGS